jgi:hypothetical protein
VSWDDDDALGWWVLIGGLAFLIVVFAGVS